MIRIDIKNSSGSYEKTNPDLSKFTFSEIKKSEGSFFSVKGSVSFFNSDYDLIKNLGENIILGKLYQNGFKLCNIVGNYEGLEEDVNNKKIQISFYVSDVMLNIEKKQDVEYNVLAVAPIIGTIGFDYQQPFEYYSNSIDFEMKVTADTFFDYVGDESSTAPQMWITRPPYGSTTAWLLTEATYKKIGEQGITLYGNVTYTFVTEIAYTGNETIYPEGTGWSFAENIEVGSYTFAKFVRYPASAPITTTIYSNSLWLGVAGYKVSYAKNALIDSSFLNANTYNCPNPRRLTDIIKYLVEKLDTSIQFDNSGTVTDSFYGFKNLEIGGVKYFDNIFLFQLTDLIPIAPSGALPNNRATIGKLTFRILTNWLINYGFKWHIEYRSGVPYFMLSHKLSITSTTQPINFSNYLGYDFGQNNNKFKTDVPEYSTLLNETITTNPDFLGTNIEFLKVVTPTSKSILEKNFYVDYAHIIAEPSAYDDMSITQFVILATNGTDTIILDSKLLEKKITNAPMSFAFYAENIMLDLPNKNMEINGASIVADEKRLKKRKKFTFDIPIKNIRTDFDFSKEIVFLGENSEIESLEQKANENKATIILKK